MNVRPSTKADPRGPRGDAFGRHQATCAEVEALAVLGVDSVWRVCSRIRETAGRRATPPVEGHSATACDMGLFNLSLPAGLLGIASHSELPAARRSWGFRRGDHGFGDTKLLGKKYILHHPILPLTMVGVGELLASAVLKEVCGKLCSVVWKEIASQLKFSEDLDCFHGMLTIIQAVLADAERRSVREESVRLWLKKLKAVTYDIEDIFVDFESVIPPCNPEVQDDIPRQRKRSIFSHLVPQFTMASKLKKMRERVQQIKHEMELGNFNFKQDTSSHKQDVIKERRTVASLDEEIVGRVAEKESIMVLLQTEDEPFVIPIQGLGGLGKTTPEQMVYNDSQTERAFDVLAWIYVSTKFDLEAIGKSIIFIPVSWKKLLSSC
ncbi:hypothetical protein E2562_019176 [Oryza meyeriana var. granulata]|uniref:Rx N-terminal domain-containing protein n=1 Tax=Oryza meyeriana var. granulata TaxID=110450 RepID=A0A6G1CQJ2_9ORYZ|nr:hypothetical protein E2562_019176 [Oryza meyeriana var. granulata]